MLIGYKGFQITGQFKNKSALTVEPSIFRVVNMGITEQRNNCKTLRNI